MQYLASWTDSHSNTMLKFTKDKEKKEESRHIFQLAPKNLLFCFAIAISRIPKIIAKIKILYSFSLLLGTWSGLIAEVLIHLDLTFSWIFEITLISCWLMSLNTKRLTNLHLSRFFLP